MAIIGSIRKHSALAVIIVGIAIAAFVLSDLFKPGRGKMPPLGVIDGEEITLNDYNRKVDENLEIQRTNQQKENLTAGEIFNVKTSTWNQIMQEVIMGKEYDALGLTVTEDELWDQVQGPNPHDVIKQYFVDPNTNQYSSQVVLNFLQNIDQVDAATRTQWLRLEKYIKEDRLSKKYQSLVSKGFYVPNAFAEMDFTDKRKNAEVRYVAAKYTNLSDSLFTLTDEDYEKYYEKNKFRYEQEGSRDIDYVIFDVLPSEDDRQGISEDVTQTYNEFLKAADVPAFVNATSDNRYDSSFYKQGTLPVQIDSLMFNSAVGTFVEPYQENDAWHMAKLMDIQYRPDSLKAEHVLIAFQGAFRAAPEITRTKEDAEALADSLLAIIQSNPARLSELAMAFSDDGSAQQNNGDLGWFADGTMVYQFNEAVINNDINDVVIAETMFGYHVIKVTGKQENVKKIRIAMIDNEIVPSSKTYQDVYTQASIFAGENSTSDKFEQAVIDQGLNKRTSSYLRKMGATIPGIDNAREIVRWAYYDGINVGDVSPVFDVGGSYVVAAITNSREKGPSPLDQIKENLTSFVMNEKKAEQLLEIANSASSLDQFGLDVNAAVDTSKNLTFSSRNIPGFGSELDMIGTIFGTEQTGVNIPVKGNGAVFLMNIDGFTDPGPASNLSLYKGQIKSSFGTRVSSNYMFTALQEKAEVEDNRLTYY